MAIIRETVAELRVRIAGNALRTQRLNGLVADLGLAETDYIELNTNGADPVVTVWQAKLMRLRLAETAQDPVEVRSVDLLGVLLSSPSDTGDAARAAELDAFSAQHSLGTRIAAQRVFHDASQALFGVGG